MMRREHFADLSNTELKKWLKARFQVCICAILNGNTDKAADLARDLHRMWRIIEDRRAALRPA